MAQNPAGHVVHVHLTIDPIEKRELVWVSRGTAEQARGYAQAKYGKAMLYAVLDPAAVNRACHSLDLLTPSIVHKLAGGIYEVVPAITTPAAA